ncbi:MAG: sigma-54-dependent Fis family transcriptional regulator [Bdellovibrionales bacterium]|nr:sigma-54-dependent Fis family transcriptional regulator [Bdellovibrionales bacterium]
MSPQTATHPRVTLGTLTTPARKALSAVKSQAYEGRLADALDTLSGVEFSLHTMRSQLEDALKRTPQKPGTETRADGPLNVPSLSRPFSTQKPSLETDFSTDHDQMQSAVTAARLFCETDMTVIIAGETGVGKGVLAEAMHHRSLRKDGPFRILNMAGLGSDLLMSHLFGHVKGAFTGAHQKRHGAFHEAKGGTLVLDDFQDLPQDIQPKLLDVLDRRVFTPIGSDAEVPADVRIIVTTQKPLLELVEQRRLRADLVHRLGYASIPLPPLSERQCDIVPLAKRMLATMGHESITLSHKAVKQMESHPWPGNLRELQQTLQLALVLRGKSTELTPEHLYFCSVSS